MIGGLDIPLHAKVALAQLRSWFVLAILLPPLDLLVAAPADADVGRGEDLVGLLGLGIVTEGEPILMGRGVALLLVFLLPSRAAATTALRHDSY